MSRNQIFVIQNSLDKIQSFDPDLRFMGFSDLYDLLSDEKVGSTLNEESHLTGNICRAILERLDDSITEVQNQAVKCLQPLVQRVDDKELQLIVDVVNDKFKSHRDMSTSIYSMAFKTIISCSKATESVTHILARSLIPTLQELVIDQWTTEDIEILIDLIRRYGSSFSSAELHTSQQLLFSLLQDGRGLTRRRAVLGVGILSKYLSPARWDSVIASLINGLQSSETDKRRICVRLTATLSKYDAVRFKSFVKDVFKHLYTALLPENDASFQDNITDQADNEFLECQEEILNAFENIVLFQPAEASLHLSELLFAAQTFINYDPNYNMDELEDGQETDSFDDTEDGYGSELEEEEFSDDEDQSWKLRRSAVKLAAALASSNQKCLFQIYESLLSSMISRFSVERENAVKIELIKTLKLFISLSSYDGAFYKLKELDHRNSFRRRGSDTSMLTGSDPQSFLSEFSSKLINLALTAVEKSSTAIVEYPTFLLSMIKELLETCAVSDADIVSIIECLERLSSSKSAFMVDILQLVEAVLLGEYTIKREMYEKLTSLILLGINDSYYKVSSEALQACLCLLNKLRSQPGNVSFFLVAPLHPIITEKAISNNCDMECRELSIRAIGRICSSSVPEKILDESLKSLQTLLSNETLRLQALNAITHIAESINDVSEFWVLTLATSVAPLFNFRPRAVRHAALTFVSRLMPRMISFSEKPELCATAVLIVDGITNDKNLFHQDAQLLILSVNVLSEMLRFLSPGSPQRSQIMSYALALLNIDNAVGSDDSNFAQVSAEHSDGSTTYQRQSQDIAKLICSITDDYDEAQLRAFYESVVSNGSKTDIRARVAADLIIRGHLTDIFAYYEELVVSHDKQSLEDVEWALSVYGYLGLQNDESYKRIIELLYSILKDSKEKLGIKCAKSLGSIISHHMEYTDELLDALHAENTSNRYLLLLALKQAIVDAASSTTDGANVEGEFNKISNQLFSLDLRDSVSNTEDIESGSKIPIAFNDTNDEEVLISECIGRLSALCPSHALESLRKYWKSNDRAHRTVALDALRFLFDASSAEDDKSLMSEDNLRFLVDDVQQLLDDRDVTIRARALSVLILALHRQPDILVPYLDKLLAHVSKETIPDPSMVRTIQMGPFKHKVDDGLESRKTAYEAIWTIANTFDAKKLGQSALLPTLIERVIDGLSDEHEIKILSLFIIARFAQTDLRLITMGRTLEKIVEKFSALVSVAIKENAIKQEMEKQSEIIRNIMRTSTSIDKEMSSAKTTGLLGMSDVELKIWTDFFHQIKQKYPEIAV